MKWLNHFPVDSELGKMHEYIVRGGGTVKGWEKFL